MRAMAGAAEKALLLIGLPHKKLPAAKDVREH